MPFTKLILALATAFMTGSTPPTPVTFVLMDAFPNQPTLTAVARRDHRRGDAEYVAVRRSMLTPELLFAATKALKESARRDGPTPTHSVTVYFTDKRRVPGLTPDQRAFAQRIIDALTRANSRAVAGIDGEHHVVTLDVAAMPQ